jgi:hypothetical protein
VEKVEVRRRWAVETLFGLLVAAALAAGAVGTADLLTSDTSVSDTSASTGPLSPSGNPPPRVAFADRHIEALATEAMRQISYPWTERLPDWYVEFVPGDDDVAGYTWSHEQRIEIFVRPGDTADSLARVLAHELGHAVDVTFNDGNERRRWLDQRGAPDAPWWPNSGSADFDTGAGDFAECFAVWQVGDQDYRGRLAPSPSLLDLALLVQLAQG